MILFIFEGKDDEPRLYKTLKEIFLFFDYDIKPVDSFNKLSIEQQNERISMLLSFFNSTEIGTERAGIKLFINYPMIYSTILINIRNIYIILFYNFPKILHL